MASNLTDRVNGFNSSSGFKIPVTCATTVAGGNITLSGEQTIDGITTNEDRVLVKDQTDNTENGIYDTSTGAWSRSSDFDGNRDVVTGTAVLVVSGTTNGDTLWRVSTAGDPKPTEAMDFIEFPAGADGATGPAGPTGADGTVDISTLDNITSLQLALDEILVRDDSAAANKAITIQVLWDAITNLTAETSPATDDEIPIYDKSGTATDKITIENLLKVVNSLTTDGSPDASSDYILTYDDSASAPKKVLLQTAANTASIATSNIQDNAVTLAKQASGTGDRLQGFDASGNPSEMTAGTNITIASGVVSAAGGSTSAGDVGTYMLGETNDSSTNTFGDTIAGSNLSPCSVTGTEDATVPSGTWRCMGYATGNGTSAVTVWVRTV